MILHAHAEAGEWIRPVVLDAMGSAAMSLSVYPRDVRSSLMQSVCGLFEPATRGRVVGSFVVYASRSAIFTCGSHSCRVNPPPSRRTAGPDRVDERLLKLAHRARFWANPTPTAVISILVAINATAIRFIAPVLQVEI